jgi:hypothetical protein
LTHSHMNVGCCRCPVVLGLLWTHGGQRQPSGTNHQSGLVVRAVLWGGTVQAAWLSFMDVQDLEDEPKKSLKWGCYGLWLLREPLQLGIHSVGWDGDGQGHPLSSPSWAGHVTSLAPKFPRFLSELLKRIEDGGWEGVLQQLKALQACAWDSRSFWGRSSWQGMKMRWTFLY